MASKHSEPAAAEESPEKPNPDPASVRRAAEDLGPGSYEENAETADEIPLGSEDVQEPPD